MCEILLNVVDVSVRLLDSRSVVNLSQLPPVYCIPSSLSLYVNICNCSIMFSLYCFISSACSKWFVLDLLSWILPWMCYGCVKYLCEFLLVIITAVQQLSKLNICSHPHVSRMQIGFVFCIIVCCTSEHFPAYVLNCFCILYMCQNEPIWC